MQTRCAEALAVWRYELGYREYWSHQIPSWYLVLQVGTAQQW